MINTSQSRFDYHPLFTKVACAREEKLTGHKESGENRTRTMNGLRSLFTDIFRPLT